MKGFFRASWFGPTFLNQKVIEGWLKSRLTGDKVLETKAVSVKKEMADCGDSHDQKLH
jgi:hypothetical protein